MKSDKPVAIITGGSGFLGSAIATELIHLGWHVISLSRTSSKHPGVESFQCDITNELEVQKVANHILAIHTEIAAIIHTSATSLVRKPILETSTESFTEDMFTSVFGAFFIAKALLPHLKKNSAFIAITSEAIEKTYTKNLGSYITTKHALRGLLQTIAKETDSEKVRVYAVSPGFLPGGLNSDLSKSVLDLMSQKSDSSVDKTVKIITTLCSNINTYEPGSSISVSDTKISPL